MIHFTEGKTPIVSVIMPVYNSEEYVSHAIDTILEQDFDDFELLLVDDGSTDNSRVICDQYAQNSAKIRVIHKENGGICSARNRGLEEAKGRYVTFCDNDDEVLPGFLEDNVRIAEQNNSDMVRFSREHAFLRDGKVVRKEVLKAQRELDLNDEDFPERYFELMKILGGVWTGLYRLETLKKNNIRFHEGIRKGYEDIYFNLCVLKATRKISVNTKVYYRWVQRQEHSTSRKFSSERLWAIEECLVLEDEINKMLGVDKAFPERWMKYYVVTYLVRVLNDIANSNVKMSYKDRLMYLNDFRDKEVFSGLDEMGKISFKELHIKTDILYALFAKRHMSLLLLIYAVYLKVLRL